MFIYYTEICFVYDLSFFQWPTVTVVWGMWIWINKKWNRRELAASWNFFSRPFIFCIHNYSVWFCICSTQERYKHIMIDQSLILLIKYQVYGFLQISHVTLPIAHISAVIFKEHFENIPLKSCNIARIFIKLLERFLKYCRNLAMSAQNITNVMLLQYWYFILILL